MMYQWYVHYSSVLNDSNQRVYVKLAIIRNHNIKASTHVTMARGLTTLIMVNIVAIYYKE